MKLILKLIFFVFIIKNGVYSQYELQQEDTVYDYNERFYLNGKLNTPCKFVFYVTDSVSKYTMYHQDRYFFSNFPSNQIKHTRNGKWVIYFNKNYQEVDSSNHSHYRLVEYINGLTMGSIYEFDNKNNLKLVIINYPVIYSDSVFDGLKKIHFDRNHKIKKIEFINFESNPLYYDLYIFNRNGVLKKQNKLDEKNDMLIVRKFRKDNSSKSELIRTKEELKKYKMTRKGRKRLIYNYKRN